MKNGNHVDPELASIDRALSRIDRTRQDLPLLETIKEIRGRIEAAERRLEAASSRPDKDDLAELRARLERISLSAA